MQKPRKRRISVVLLALVAIGLALPWIAGQLIAWKVKRQIAQLDQHPGVSVIEQSWHSHYSNSHGHIVLTERVGCGVRNCGDIRIDIAARHLNFSPLGWGKVVASTDMNSLFEQPLTPPVQPFHLLAQVGIVGRSQLTMQMSPSWHELHAERADAIAFSGIYATFNASQYASRWQGDLNASFTVITEKASPAQRQKISEVMQSLGTDRPTAPENFGAIVVRVFALMKELSAAVNVWQGKQLAWRPQINALPHSNPKQLLKDGLPELAAHNPLKLELSPDIFQPSHHGAPRKVALELPSFEAWHGQQPMPPIVQKMGPATYESEPELDVWQLNLRFANNKLSLNGLALWKQH